MDFMFKYSLVFYKCCLLLCVILPVVGCRVSAEWPLNTTQTSVDMTASHCRMCHKSSSTSNGNNYSSKIMDQKNMDKRQESA